MLIASAMVAAMVELKLAALHITSFKANQPGEYYQLLDSRYDKETNQTLGVMVRYSVAIPNDTSAHAQLAQLVILPGQVSDDAIIATQHWDDYIKLVK